MAGGSAPEDPADPPASAPVVVHPAAARALAERPGADPVPIERRVAAARLDVRQLIAMANELLALAADLEGIAPHPGDDGHAGADRATLLAMARAEYRRRRNRDGFFDSAALFGEPAWDMLLDLFIAGLEGKQVPVTSACIGACVPPTTALRWLTLIEERGMLVRVPDPADARRAHVSLTPLAMAAMEAYFQGSSRPAGR